MAKICIAPTRVAQFPTGGGHFWVYMQYVQGFLRNRCDVHWLEKLEPSHDASRDRKLVERLRQRLDAFGLGGRLLVYTESEDRVEFLDDAAGRAEAVCRDADLLLDFRYDTSPEMLSRFRRTALVDIDPGLLQFWMSAGQIEVSPHDVYFTIGETVGTPQARFPDCGLPWVHIRPAVDLDLWPFKYDPSAAAYTSISGWSGDEWIQDGEQLYENTKRVSFLPFQELPKQTPSTLELALNLGFGEPDEGDRARLLRLGWHVRSAAQVAGTPESYRQYIQTSRGEFGCAKPFYILKQTAWISDRTVCYLASGKPAVVQNTGTSHDVPGGLGLLRFSTLEEAVAALAAVEADYARHCQAARELAGAHFDARRITRFILSQTEYTSGSATG